MNDDPRLGDPPPPSCCCGGPSPGAAGPNEAAEPSSLEQVLAAVDRVLANPEQRLELVPLLQESHPVYRGQSAGFVADLRGWILAAFGGVGLPEDALIFAMEELQSGVEAYLVGAAARALRGYREPRSDFAQLLLVAANNMRQRDDAISFERYGAKVRTLGEGTTALIEIATTFEWMGRHARSALPALVTQKRTASKALAARLQDAIDRIQGDTQSDAPEEPEAPRPSCCSSMKSPAPATAGPERTVDLQAVQALEMQDQDGHVLRFGEFFSGCISVVTFFYTRCDNPFKCPVTMAHLASFQRLLLAEGLDDRVRTAAITYDPAFDLPIELKGYGGAYNVRMDGGHRLLRNATPDDFETMRAYFRLGVNYVDSIVNRRRIEAYILDEEGRVAKALTHLRWDEHELVAMVRALL